MKGPDYIASRKVYRRMLRWWAAQTRSYAEEAWRGPGLYRYSGYLDDDGRPVAVVERCR